MSAHCAFPGGGLQRMLERLAARPDLALVHFRSPAEAEAWPEAL